jgi:sulfur-carrier protein
MPYVSVSLPGALLAKVGNRASVTVAGDTVRDIINALEQEFPGLRFNLCYETGELRPYVNVFLNSANIRYLQGLDTPIPAETRMYILQSVAGGWFPNFGLKKQFF